MILRFESVADLGRACRDMPPAHRREEGRDPKWFGGESWDDSLRFCATGDARLVPEAEAMLSKLEAQIDAPVTQWLPSVAGAYPIVPEALLGLPEPMRRRVNVSDDRAPIRLFVCTTASFRVPAKVMMRRGAAVFALALQLSRVRPIEIYAVNIMDGRDGRESVVCTRINAAPLDIATACYALTSAGFCRRLNYGLGYWKHGSQGRWPQAYKYGNPFPYLDALKLRLGGSEADVFVKPTEADDKIAARPLEWIQAELRRFTTDAA